MSHIVEIQTQVRDPVAIAAACRRLGLAEPVERTVKLFSSEVLGFAVQLPGWNYPVVCDTASGQLRYDNFNGHWGDPARLGEFLCSYAIEKVRLEARSKGYTVTEQALADGQTKLTVQIGGAI